MTTSNAWAAYAPHEAPTPITLERRSLRRDDVTVRLHFCGLCASDLHVIDHAPSDRFPIVTGHEAVGVVEAVGTEVSRLAVGDPVAVGNIVDSCGDCVACRAGQENYCYRGVTSTYLGTDRHDGSITQGLFADRVVVREHFVHALPATLDPAGAAPLLCAGATVWEPLRRFDAGPGTNLGIVGLGGLGHLALKFAHALGASVVVFTTSPHKEQAARELGADDVVMSTDLDAVRARRGTLDLVLDTASATRDLSPLLRALAVGGTLCTVGIPARFDVERAALSGRNFAASGTAGIPRTREMLEFCGEHRIVADVETLPVSEIATAMDRLRRGDVRGRFSLDLTH